MKACFAAALFLLAGISQAQEIRRDLPYVDNGHTRHKLDVYTPGAEGKCPVVFWIHGGGWQAGDKSSVQDKPRLFSERGCVFVSTNYRLLPEVDMDTLVGDVAKALGWVHHHIAEYGGDPQKILVGGHSAGAQLAALLCTDPHWLQAEGVAFSALIGCLPVDGDTYDIPAIIETAETRRRVHGLPPAKFGHREKFMHSPEKHRAFSAVSHLAAGRGIPPFLILHVVDHPDTSAQAVRLEQGLQQAGIAVRRFGARRTDHVKLNDDLGLPGDEATREVQAFLDRLQL